MFGMNAYHYLEESVIRTHALYLTQRHEKGYLIDFTGIDPENLEGSCNDPVKKSVQNVFGGREGEERDKS